MSKYQWDRKSIKEYREKHEPYSNDEKFFIDIHNSDNPFWRDRLQRIKDGFIDGREYPCSECKTGTITEPKQVLPSGLNVMTRRCSNPDCHFFISLVLTPEDEVLDYTQKPEKEAPIVRKLSKEDMKKADEAFKKLRW